MIINYTDGSALKCSKIKIMGDKLFADEYYIVELSEVESIEESTEEE